MVKGFEEVVDRYSPDPAPSIAGGMSDERRRATVENLEGWAAMSDDNLSRQVAAVFVDVSDEDLQVLGELDRFESDRIEARRRYEEFHDAPRLPRRSSAG